MASKEDAYSLSSKSLPFDEGRWVTQIRDALEEDEEDERRVSVSVSVFAIPKQLLSVKPEAFRPQLFAIGPYHHWQPHLYEMERYKLATAKRTQRQLRGGLKLDHLVDYFKEHEYFIRAHYHRYLEFSAETLGWLMVIDASFLLQFLLNYVDCDGKAFKKIPSMSHMVDSERIKLTYNLILRDVVMLENQIPLFLIRKILHCKLPSPESADEVLSKSLKGLVAEVSPFKAVDNFSSVDLSQQAHLLQLLYAMIVCKARPLCRMGTADEFSVDVPGVTEEAESPKEDLGYVTKLFSSAWSSAKGLNISKALHKYSKPAKFLVKVPWGVISKLPVVSALKGHMAAQKMDDVEEKTGLAVMADNKAMLVEEIMIPSVTELAKAGVRFLATRGDLSTIAFDAKTGTFSIPSVTLDVNTEVVLRNLVAYEASVESGPMVFTRYTELINGIVDSEEDVRLLRESGIIVNRMKTDGEVADMWNGMSRSVRLAKVGFIDRVLVDVNCYYNCRWSVRSRRFMATYVMGSWQLLVFFGALLLLLLTCVESFCTVYECEPHWTNSVTKSD